MPLYDFRCKCGHLEDFFRRIDSRDNEVKCSKCGLVMERVITPPMVMPDIQPYKAVAGDQRWIHSRAQHRSFLKENNLIEIGNEGKPK